jgi:hypothetical protein
MYRIVILLLGLILEQVTARSVAEVLRIVSTRGSARRRVQASPIYRRQR